MDIIERFISYTQINTTTDREKGARGIMPSSPGQLMLAQRLGEELRALGLQEVQVRENAIVTAMLPANCDRPLPTVAFLPTWIPAPSRALIPMPRCCLTTAAICA